MSERTKGISLGASTLWFAGPYAFALVAYFGVNALAARLLGTANFGQFIAVVTVTTLLGQVSLLGVHRSGLREAARLRDADDPAERELQLRAVRAVTRIVLPGMGLLGAAGAWLWLPATGFATWAVPACVGALIVGSGHQLLWSNYLRGFGDVRIAGLLEGRSGGALVAGAQMLLLGCVLILDPERGFLGALAAMAVGYALPLLAVSRLVARHWRGVQVMWRPLSDLRVAWSRGIKFAVIQAGSYLNTNLDLWIAALLLTNADSSLFAASARMVLLLVIPLTSLQVVFAPVISRLYARGELQRLEGLIRTAATLIAGLMLLAWLVLVSRPGFFLGVTFGEAFRSAAPVLVILSIGIVVQVLTGMCATALSMTHQEGIVATVHAAGLVGRVCLGVTAAVTGGVVALSLTSAAVTAAVFVALWWLARSRLSMSTQPTLRPKLSLLMRTPG